MQIMFRNHDIYAGDNIFPFNKIIRNKNIAPYLRATIGYTFHRELNVTEQRRSLYRDTENFELKASEGPPDFPLWITYGLGLSLRNAHPTERLRVFIECQIRQLSLNDSPFMGFIEPRIGIGYNLPIKKKSQSLD